MATNKKMENDIMQSHAQNGTRAEEYRSLIPQIAGLIAGEDNLTGILANVSAALRSAFGERFFWTGFYLREGDELLLGPFQGTVACYRIGYGRGVCGTAWAQDKTIIVDDVEQFAGHIACSSLSRSEIVVPLHDASGNVAGVLDIDSTDLAAFDADDQEGLESICHLLTPLFTKHSDNRQEP